VRYDRRSLLGLAARVGVVVGIALLGTMRSVKRAYANFPYQSHSRCGGYDPDTWNGFDGNNNGWLEPGTCDDDVCIGAPDDAMGRWYCTTCREVSPSNPYGWHYSGQRGPFFYGDATDLCTVNGIARDAWQWQVARCNDCAPAA